MNIQELEYMSARAGEVAALMGDLSNPGRLRILCALAAGPMEVGALSRALALPQPTVSRHLATLREAGMVASSRDGTRVLNRLADPKVAELMAVLHRLYCAPPPD